MVLQAAGNLSGKRTGMADQHQQDVNDELRLEGGGQPGRLAVGEALPAGPQLAVSGRAVGEIDIDAAQPLAAGALAADSGEQEGAHGNLEKSGEFLGGEAVCGFAEQALDGVGEGAVAGEVGVADGEEAEAVKPSGVKEGVEAAVVVVAAEVADLAEVAGGGAKGDLAEGLLELIDGDGGVGGEQGEEQIGGAGGHDVLVFHKLITYDIVGHFKGGNECPWKGYGRGTAQNQGLAAIQPRENGRVCQTCVRLTTAISMTYQFLTEF